MGLRYFSLAGETEALADISLVLQPGDFVSIIGPSGCGKSTLLSLIAGILKPTQGEVLVDETPVSGPSRRIGYMLQQDYLFEWRSILDNAVLGAEVQGMDRARARASAAELLERYGLGDFLNHRPQQLSGGMRQRVALARTLCTEPGVVLLDEPFSALDAKLRVELREEVREMLRTVGSTVVLVTHDQAEAMTMADHLAVMRNGKVVAAGTPRDVYDRPVDIELARFLGTTTVLTGRVVPDGAGACVECALGRLALHEWDGCVGSCDVLIRPEDLIVEPAGSVAGAGITVGSVRGMSYFGADALVHVALPGSPEYVAVRVPGHELLQPGDSVSLAVIRPVSTYPSGRAPEPGTPDVDAGSKTDPGANRGAA